jgi:hypothetical protein
MRHFPPPRIAEIEEILTVSARCWRTARDGGLPVQPALFRALEESDRGLLAPVFDSLFTLYEAAIGRPLAPGRAARLSEDERRLLGFMDGTAPRRACLDCPEGAATALDCAICSTRIMIGLAASPSL